MLIMQAHVISKPVQGSVVRERLGEFGLCEGVDGGRVVDGGVEEVVFCYEMAGAGM